MSAYWIVFAIMFLLQLVKVNTQKEYLWRLVISFIPLFLFAAFRVDFGNDYAAYQETFDIVHAAPGQYDDLRDEIGYLKLNEWMPSFRWLIIVTSAFTCFTYVVVFYRYIPKNYSWLAILLLFLAGDSTIFFMLSGIRNAISISILLLSVPLLERRKILPFLLCMFLASLFHKTAYIYFPLAYFISSNKDVTRREIFVWVGVFCFFFIFSHMSIMNVVEQAMSVFFDDRYDVYVASINEWGDNRGTLGLLGALLTFVPLIGFINHHSFSPIYNVIARLGLMYTIATILGPLNMRTTQHFVMFFIVLVIQVFARSKIDVLKYGYVLFVITYFAYALFVVEFNSPYFSYDVYESTLFGVFE